MNNSKMLFEEVVGRITLDDPKSEVISIAEFILQTIFSLTRTDILASRPVQLSDEDRRSLEAVISRVNKGEPVQYVLGQVSFFGRRFEVGPAVLIPRPETEELIGYALQLPFNNSPAGLSILDVGTGSGCIAITLALETTNSRVYGTDISPEALDMARTNATQLGASVEFVEHDILAEDITYRDIDLVVSNPPYVSSSEQHLLKSNVVNFEPHAALFVPEEDPLIFYRAIVKKTFPAIRPGGYLVVEINERFGKQVEFILANGGFDAKVITDMSGKDRIVCGRKPAN